MNINRRILTVSIKYCLSITLIGFVILLMGCGKAEVSVNVDIENGTGLSNKDKEQPVAVSAQVSAETFIIDLNNSANVNIEILTTFDDDTSTSKTYLLTWNIASETLQLSDKESNVIEIETDSSTLQNATSLIVTVVDKLFPQKLILTILLIPETISELNISYTTVDLNIGESAILSLSATFKSGKLLSDATSIAVCFDDSIDKNIIEVQDDCTVKRIANGEAKVSAKLIDAQAVSPVVNGFSFPAIIVQDPTVISLEVAYSDTNLIIGDEAQLTLSAKLSNNQLITDATSIAKCVDVSIDTSLIDITSECRVLGKKEGRAIISAELKNMQSIVPEVVEFVIDIKPAPDVITILDVLYTGGELKIGESATLSLSATLKSGKLISDATSIAVCFDNSIDKNVIEVQGDCSVKRIANGEAEVSAKLIDAQTVSPVVNGFSFPEIIVQDPTVILLEVAYSDANLIVGEEAQLTLSATLSNNQLITDATSIAKCIDLSIDIQLIDVMTDCRVLGNKEGRATISAELVDAQTNTPQVVNLAIDIKPAPLTIETIDLIYQNLSSVNLISGNSIDVQMKTTWTDGVSTTETLTMACISNPDNESILISVTGCQVSAFRPGTFQIALSAIPVIAGITSNTVFNPLEIVVSSRILSETANGSGVYDINILAGVSDIFMELPNINQGIYKVKLISDNVLTEYEMFLATYDVFDAASIIANTLCYNKIFPQKKSLACGVSKSILGEVYVELQGISSNGFAGTLNLTSDPDIFFSDNGGINNPISINHYKILSLGQDRAGRVSTNSIKNNNARYYSDETKGLPLATSYTVTVTFDPDSNNPSLYHFNQNNVQVGWVLNGFDYQPTIRCSFYGANPSCNLTTNVNSLVYTIFDPKTDIYITIFGNGSNSVNGSPATADGELSYTVRLESN